MKAFNFDRTPAWTSPRVNVNLKIWSKIENWKWTYCDFGIFYSDILTETDWTRDRHCPYEVLSTYYVLSGCKCRINKKNTIPVGLTKLLQWLVVAFFICTGELFPDAIVAMTPAKMGVDHQFLFTVENFSTLVLFVCVPVRSGKFADQRQSWWRRWRRGCLHRWGWCWWGSCELWCWRCTCRRCWGYRVICWSVQTRWWSWDKIELLLQKLLSPPRVPPPGRRAYPLLCHSGFNFTPSGVQRKGERGVGELEVEGLALAGQRLAEGQTLGYQGRIHHSCHFHLFFWIMKIAGRPKGMLLSSLRAWEIDIVNAARILVLSTSK